MVLSQQMLQATLSTITTQDAIYEMYTILL
jgi:hypothetical protein